MNDSFYRSDPELWHAFCSLSAEVRTRLLATDVKISTPGEVLKCGAQLAQDGLNPSDCEKPAGT